MFSIQRLIFSMAKSEFRVDILRWIQRAKSSGYSRAERRAIDRKQRNKERKEAARGMKQKKNSVKVSLESSLTQVRKLNSSMCYPKVPGGGNLYLRRHHFKFLGYRLPLVFSFCYLLTNEDYSPFVVQGSIGPSMLPTIQFIGDLWLIQTCAWHHLLGLDTPLQAGDIVLWKDPETQRVSCKRVIGLEGEDVLIYGEYAELYHNREDWGIVMPSKAESRALKLDWDDNKIRDEIAKTMTVPSGHVWLEGDSPLFSLDSRHFGPIPISYIQGRLICRVWPLSRKNDNGKPIPCRLTRHRPVPFPAIESYLGEAFNFYRVTKET